MPRPVDRLDGAGGQLEGFSKFGQRFSFEKPVLDLVINLLDLSLGPRRGELLLELARDLLERAHFLGLNLVHGYKEGAKAALNGRTDLALFQAEGGVCD